MIIYPRWGSNPRPWVYSTHALTSWATKTLALYYSFWWLPCTTLNIENNLIHTSHCHCKTLAAEVATGMDRVGFNGTMRVQIGIGASMEEWKWQGKRSLEVFDIVWDRCVVPEIYSQMFPPQTYRYQNDSEQLWSDLIWSGEITNQGQYQFW